MLIVTYLKMFKSLLLTFEYFCFLTTFVIPMEVVMVALGYYLCNIRGMGSAGVLVGMIALAGVKLIGYGVKLWSVDWELRM